MVTVLLFVVLWSLFAWAAHALAGWSGWSGGGTGDWRTWIDALALPAARVPAQSPEAVKAMLVVWAPLMEWRMASMPALLSGLPALLLAVWVTGTGLLVLGGALVSAAVGIWRRKLQPALVGVR